MPEFGQKIAKIIMNDNENTGAKKMNSAFTSAFPIFWKVFLQTSLLPSYTETLLNYGQPSVRRSLKRTFPISTETNGLGSTVKEDFFQPYLQLQRQRDSSQISRNAYSIHSLQ